MQRAAAIGRRIVRCAVREQSVEKQHSTGRQRRGDRPGAENDVVANLPIAPLEMHDRTFAVTPRQQLHTAVLDRRGVECDPRADHRRAERIIEIRVILVPRFLPAEPRRLHEAHVLEHLGLAVAHQFPHGREDLRVVRNRFKPGFVVHEKPDFAYRVLPLLHAERGQDRLGSRLKGDAVKRRHFAHDQIDHAGQRRGHLGRRERLAHHKIAVLPVERDFARTDVVQRGHRVGGTGLGLVKLGRV